MHVVTKVSNKDCKCLKTEVTLLIVDDKDFFVTSVVDMSSVVELGRALSLTLNSSNSSLAMDAELGTRWALRRKE